MCTCTQVCYVRGINQLLASCCNCLLLDFRTTARLKWPPYILRRYPTTKHSILYLCNPVNIFFFTFWNGIFLWTWFICSSLSGKHSFYWHILLAGLYSLELAGISLVKNIIFGRVTFSSRPESRRLKGEAASAKSTLHEVVVRSDQTV